MKDSFSNTLFTKILPSKENEELFREAIEIQQLGDEVVERLRWIQLNIEGYLWWNDKKLIGIFTELYKSGCIVLPRYGAERIRWIALLCLEFSNIYSFDAQGIITPFDFLTEDMFAIFQDMYPKSVIKEVKELRGRLDDQGWEAVFGAK